MVTRSMTKNPKQTSKKVEFLENTTECENNTSYIFNKHESKDMVGNVSRQRI